MDTRKTQTVLLLGDDVEYKFTNCTPMEALERMIEFINYSHKCDPKIKRSEKTLWFEDDGRLYAVRND